MATMTDRDPVSGMSCDRCGGDLVCRCGQEMPTYSWPCAHGGCLFECPKCDTTISPQGHADGETIQGRDK